jgi:hypothetical protein
LLAEPPTPELRRMMVDEMPRCPPAIRNTIVYDCAFRDHRDVLSEMDVPMSVCAGADEKW